MFMLHLEFPLSYVSLNQILRVNLFRTRCILLINSYKLSETRSSVYEIVYVFTILILLFQRCTVMRQFYFSYIQVKHDFSLLRANAIICGRFNITVN